MDATVAVSAVGILVSGVVGPSISGWAGRRADAQRFERDQASRRRDDLRSVVDEGARLLAVGATNVRLIREARLNDTQESEDVRDWASSVHVLQERLLLRVSSNHPVAATYRAVRESLIALDASGEAEAAVREFEERRDAFLAAARATLEAAVT